MTLLAAGAGILAAKDFSEAEVTEAVEKIVDDQSRDGVLTFADPRSGEVLTLKRDDVRVVRGLPGYGWFPNVNFHDAADPRKKYALDFWLKPDGERLKFVATRIHKAPQPDGQAWMSITRAPLPWWWLPTIERASAVAGVPAWQVMGTIHARIVEGQQDAATVLHEPEGTDLRLQLVDIEQPVGRSKADGRYFACALFRKFGNDGSFYSIAYWLDAKTKLVTAGHIKVMNDGRGGKEKAAAEPQCDVGGIAYDVVD